LCKIGLGKKTLTSSTGSLELSGEYCPGILTLTCDAVNAKVDSVINWYVDDIQVARFSMDDDSTPFITTTTPNVINGTVELTTARQRNDSIFFMNFTLSASLANFLPLQGSNVSCGTIIVRSQIFQIKEFSIIHESYTGKVDSYSKVLVLVLVIYIIKRLTQDKKWNFLYVTNCRKCEFHTHFSFHDRANFPDFMQFGSVI